MRRPRSEAATAKTQLLDAALAEAQKKVATLKHAARDVKAKLKQAKKAARRAKKAVRRARKAHDAGGNATAEVTQAQTSSAETQMMGTPVKSRPVKKAKPVKTVKTVVKPAKAATKTKATRRAKKKKAPASGRGRTIASGPASETPVPENILADASRAADWNQDEWTADVAVKSE